MMMGRSKMTKKKQTFLAYCTPHLERNSSLPSANSQLLAWCKSFRLSVHLQIYFSIKWNKVHTFSIVSNFLPPHEATPCWNSTQTKLSYTILFLSVQKIKPRRSCILGTNSTIEPHPSHLNPSLLSAPPCCQLQKNFAQKTCTIL